MLWYICNWPTCCFYSTICRWPVWGNFSCSFLKGVHKLFLQTSKNTTWHFNQADLPLRCGERQEDYTPIAHLQKTSRADAVHMVKLQSRESALKNDLHTNKKSIRLMAIKPSFISPQSYHTKPASVNLKIEQGRVQNIYRFINTSYCLQNNLLTLRNLLIELGRPL